MEEEIPRRIKRGRGRPNKNIEQACKEYEDNKSSMTDKEKGIARNNIASIKYRRRKKEENDLKKSLQK